MTTATHTPPGPTQTTPAPEWARALLERQLWILGQLAEGGLEIARAIERQATGEGSEAGAPQAVDAHVPMAYARVARAVRMTILLQSKLIADLQALEVKAADAAAEAHSRLGSRRIGQAHDQKRRLGRIVGRIAWADGRDAERAQRLAREAVERLEQDELYGDILTRPVSELIGRLCADMGLAPDWPALAEEAWAKAEMEAGGGGGPWAGVMTTPRPAANDQAPLTPQAASP
jgi:hypothetical protein